MFYHPSKDKPLYTRKTLDRQTAKLVELLELGNVTADERCFLYGALFALQWFGPHNRTCAPAQFIQWRRKQRVGQFTARDVWPKLP